MLSILGGLISYFLLTKPPWLYYSEAKLNDGFAMPMGKRGRFHLHQKIRGGSAMAAEIKVGATAPDFSLKDQDQKDVKLSDYKGKKNVVLAFYPLDWSPVCTTENKCLNDDFPKFQSASTEVLGISRDSVYSHKAWQEALGLKHRLLSDMSGDVAKKYGMWLDDKFITKRATVVVDKQGTVQYVKVQEILTARDDNEILIALKSLK
jgi:peroxiredoxin